MGRRTWAFVGVCCLSFAVCAEDYLSPSAVVADKDGKKLYIAESTAEQVALFDIAAGKVEKAISLPLNPTGLALTSDSVWLYVTGNAPEGKVFAVDVKTGKVKGQIPVGHTPMSPVLSPDGGTLYVCNRFTNDVSVIDVATGKEVARVPVLREPFAAAVTPDGKSLIVANLLPVGPGDVDYVAAAVTVIDTASRKVAATLQLPNGCTTLKGVCVSPDGKYAYVAHTLGRFHVPTTQLERGWMNTNALTVIDTAANKLVNTALLDDVDLGAANPWGVACSADGKWLCVTHAGTHELSVIDREALHKKLDRVAAGEKVSSVSQKPEDVPNDLSFMVGIRRRLKLEGNGPRGLVLVGTKAYVAEYFTDSLGVIDVNPEVRPRAVSLPLYAKKPKMTQVRTGEMFFHDASLCFQHWQSCSSCHPDARTDGLNWDLLNDGMGNPKQVKSMLLAHKTPPSMMSGIREKAEVAVRSGIKFIQFAVRPEEDAVAIDEYLKSLRPVPSPRLVKGKLSDAAKRGQKIYEKAGCAHCHYGAVRTDLKQYDVGTATGLDAGKEYDTPTLVECWRTAPYLVDGRAATMADVITKCNPNDKHGKTSALTPQEVSDLVEFVLSQ